MDIKHYSLNKSLFDSLLKNLKQTNHKRNYNTINPLYTLLMYIHIHIHIHTSIYVYIILKR
jgi:hypothetical protein